LVTKEKIIYRKSSNQSWLISTQVILSHQRAVVKWENAKAHDKAILENWAGVNSKWSWKSNEAKKLTLSNEFYRQTPTNVKLSGGRGPMTLPQQVKTHQEGS